MDNIMEESFLSHPTFWVAIAFLLFVGLTYKKIAGFFLRALDERSAKIAAELDQARALREQAETLLAEYRKKQEEYLNEAEAMLEKARQDAGMLRKQLETELKESLESRRKQALDKIAREEERAVQEVRSNVVDIALATARAVISTHVGKLSQDDLVKLAMADIERKIH